MSYKRIICYALVLLWMAIIFAFSHQPDTVSSGQSGAVMQSVGQLIGVELGENLTRKGAHALVYGVLGVLVLLALRTHQLRRQTAAWLALVVVFVYAITDEIHQIFIPGRSGQVSDVLLDTAAGAVAIALALLTRKIILHKNQK